MSEVVSSRQSTSRSNSRSNQQGKIMERRSSRKNSFDDLVARRNFNPHFTQLDCHNRPATSSASYTVADKIGVDRRTTSKPPGPGSFYYRPPKPRVTPEPSLGKFRISALPPDQRKKRLELFEKFKADSAMPKHARYDMMASSQFRESGGRSVAEVTGTMFNVVHDATMSKHWSHVLRGQKY